MKIAIALPTHDMVPAGFMFAVTNLAAYTVASVKSIELGVTMIAGTYVHSARQKLLANLLVQEVDHILWLDSDMTFPRDSLLRLLKHDKDVVGINYAKREAPPEYVAIKTVDYEHGQSVKLVTDDKSTGLETVDAMGFGMVLMRTEKLYSLPDPREEPWFFFRWLAGGRQEGEDVYFCRLLRERLGMELFVDHDLSKECRHIGQFPYALHHVGLEADE